MIYRILLFWIIFYATQAAAGYYDEHANGWHWYEINQEERKEEKMKDLTSLPPIEAIKKIKKEIEEKKAKAILYPNEENLYDYLKTQEHWASQAEKFSKMWQWVVNKNPELNYGLKHPTSELAKKVEFIASRKEANEAISMIGRNYGLFYFYRANCPFCTKFSPILRAFSDKYQLKILPISLDGSSNQAFSSFKANNGIAEKWGVSHVPALFAVSPNKNEIIPIAFGLVSQNELEQRFLMFAKYLKEQKHD